MSAGWFAAGQGAGERWQIIGGAAICAVALVAAVLALRDNSAAKSPYGSPPDGPPPTDSLPAPGEPERAGAAERG